ncbi:MAG TPA: hypothetical protein VGN20_19170 [Mucilaginibacter sp.]|jgi:hypothetical protein
MKQNKNSLQKIFLSGLLLIIVAATASAQKLPKVQGISVRAPKNIKIDGRSTEWKNGTFQAYNTSDRIYYTMSNDDDNLYLIVRTPGLSEGEKVIRGGVVLTISHSLSKKTRESASGNVSIKFPIASSDKFFSITQAYDEYNAFKKDTVAYQKQIDSLTWGVNKMADESFKQIGVVGIKNIEGPLVSIYNEYGIKAMVKIDRKMAFTCELAIPLKYLGISVNAPTKFSYNIELPGIPPAINKNPNALAPPTVERNGGGVSDDFEYVNNPTDFWGVYTLAKNP